MNTTFRYDSPAPAWRAGLPIGTGRLAAMILGEPIRERVSLNHEWLWRGDHQMRDTQERSQYLTKVRRLLADGQYEEATYLANQAFASWAPVDENRRIEVKSRPKTRVDAYQPAGDLWIELDGMGEEQVRDYQRVLDVERAVATVTFSADGQFVTKEYLAHPVYDLLMIRVRSSDGQIAGRIWLDRIEDPGCSLWFDSHGPTLSMDGCLQEGIDFRLEVHNRSEHGDVLGGRHFVFSETNEVCCFVNMGTSAKKESPLWECKAYPVPDLDWDALVAEHVQQYQGNCGRLQLEVPLDDNEHISTDKRLERVRHGAEDPGLAVLFFHYGRYLLYASSATAELPANLQGKWNDELDPPWQSDYHHDINIQFSYWLAEPANLAQYTKPLFRYLERFLPRARKAAQDLYGCRGIWLPLQTDPWGRVTPESYGWAAWIGAAPWLAQHVWWHFEYSQDTVFLREMAYPFLKEVALFYEDYLVRDESGTLQIMPSQSPENRFEGSGDLPVSIGISSAMDVQLAREVLQHAAEGAQVLGVDDELRETWTEMVERLPALKVGSHGQLLEWNEEFVEREPGHRHLSHLIGLFPGDGITKEDTPELFEAANTSLSRRFQSKGFMNGRLTRAWVPCIYARMEQGSKAWEYLMESITNFAPADLIFHTDIMHAATACICEMLLHSYHGKLSFLPALPKAWPRGKVVGLRARKGYLVDFEWDAHRLVQASVVSSMDQVCVVKEKHEEYAVYDDQGGLVVDAVVDGEELRFPVVANRRYIIHRC